VAVVEGMNEYAWQQLASRVGMSIEGICAAAVSMVRLAGGGGGHSGLVAHHHADAASGDGGKAEAEAAALEHAARLACVQRVLAEGAAGRTLLQLLAEASVMLPPSKGMMASRDVWACFGDCLVPLVQRFESTRPSRVGVSVAGGGESLDLGRAGDGALAGAVEDALDTLEDMVVALHQAGILWSARAEHADVLGPLEDSCVGVLEDRRIYPDHLKAAFVDFVAAKRKRSEANLRAARARAAGAAGSGSKQRSKKATNATGAAEATATAATALLQSTTALLLTAPTTVAEAEAMME